MKKIIEDAIHSYISKNRNTIGFGMFMLNGGGELTFRGNILPFIQNSLPSNHVAVAEYTEITYKRADIAILKRNEKGDFACIAIVELKQNFTDQGASEVRKRHVKDVEKWEGLDYQKIFIHFIIEIENNDKNLKCTGKNYVCIPYNGKEKQESIELIFPRKLGSYLSEVDYPFDKTKFTTHVFSRIE